MTTLERVKLPLALVLIEDEVFQPTTGCMFRLRKRGAMLMLSLLGE